MSLGDFAGRVATRRSWIRLALGPRSSSWKRHSPRSRSKRRRRGTGDAQAATQRMRLDARRERGDLALATLALTILDQDLDHASERRIVEEAPEAHLLRRESLVVALERGTDRVVVRMIGLDHHAARTIATAGPAGQLGEESVGALDGAEVGEAR